MNYIQNLDYFLKYISEKGEYTYSHDIYTELKDIYSTTDLTLTVEKLHFDKYVDIKIDDSPNANKIEPPYYCRINYNGLRFFERGGYNDENKSKRRKIIYDTFKTIIVVANAIIIAFIAIAGVYVSYDSKRKDEMINIKEKQIEILSSKVDSLTTIQNLNKITKTKAPNR